MFFCPDCQGKTRVTRTDALWKGGGTRRERKCDVCKHNFETVEHSMAAFERAQLMDSEVRQVRELLALTKKR